MSVNEIQPNANIESESQIHRPLIASITSRILAMIYDGLIILLITSVTIFLIQLIFIGGEPLPTDHILNTLLKPIWFVPGFFYLSYYWRNSGQTPSMRIWKIKLIGKQNNRVSWLQALVRYTSALMGLGLIWSLFNKEKISFQDFMSRTLLIQHEN